VNERGWSRGVEVDDAGALFLDPRSDADSTRGFAESMHVIATVGGRRPLPDVTCR